MSGAWILSEAVLLKLGILHRALQLLILLCFFVCRQLDSLRVPSDSLLNSEEKSVLKKLKENKLSVRILLLQVQSKTHVQETFMINTVAAHAQNRLDELHKTVERYETLLCPRRLRPR